MALGIRGALRASVDPLVLLGSAVLCGGLVAVAPLPTLTAIVGSAVLLRHATQRRPSRWLALFAVLALLGGAWRAHARMVAHEEARARLVPRFTAPVRCSGRARVLDSPVSVRGALRWSASLRDVVCAEESVPPLRQESLVATLYGGPPWLARGDEVEVVATLGRPQRFSNFEGGDPRPGETRRSGLLSGGVVDARILERSHGLAALVDRARARVRGRIEATFPPETAPMARALVLGESDLAEEDDADFRTSGLSHLLAVSGMHLVLVAAGVVKGLRALLVRIVTVSARIEVGRVVAAFALPLLWAYADFAGGGGSTVRAAWMMSVALLAEAIGRRSNAHRAFGASLLVMGLADPLAAFDLSFLLSAAATLGLIALSRPLTAIVTRPLASDPRMGVRAARAVLAAMATTIAATVPCAPILARFAPTLPLGGVFANLVAVPLGESVALPVCLLHALSYPLPGAEQGCAVLATGSLSLVLSIARFFAHARWLLVAVPAPNPWQLACIAVALLALVTPTALRRTAVLVSLAAALLLEVMTARAGEPERLLRATFLDVGQGDSAIVDLPDGHAIVIDGGGLVGSPIDTGERVLAPTLRARRRSAVDLLVLSHPHPDHFGGLVHGLERVEVGALWDSGQGEREGVGGGYASVLARVRAAGAPVLRPPALCGEHTLGGVIVEVLAPCPDESPDRSPNDNSLVLRLTYGRRAFLFVGDAEGEEEHELLNGQRARLRADVLKVGHHGSRTSTSPAFLAAVAPSVAVISAGVRNRFGHPHPATLRTLAAARVRVLRTDRDGAVEAWTDGASLSVRTANEERGLDLW